MARKQDPRISVVVTPECTGANYLLAVARKYGASQSRLFREAVQIGAAMMNQMQSQDPDYFKRLAEREGAGRGRPRSEPDPSVEIKKLPGTAALPKPRRVTPASEWAGPEPLGGEEATQAGAAMSNRRRLQSLM